MQQGKALVAACLIGVLSTTVSARDQEAGSVLIYPSLRGTGFLFTLTSVTNTHPSASILVHYEYVNMLPGTDGFTHSDCVIDDVFELLTPNDTLSVPVFCHNPVSPYDGYLVISAVDAGTGLPISHNYLLGSELVLFGTNIRYQIPAVSFRSPLADGVSTDLDGDAELDFDGLEYEPCAEALFVDSFIASVGTNLALIGLTGGTKFTTTVSFSIFNDNEFPMSVTRDFRCWFDQPLDVISPAFSMAALLGTPHDPSELDVDCDGVGDVETGWVLIRGAVAFTPIQAIPSPALVGAVTSSTGLERGRPLWRRGDNLNGDFIGFADMHPEFP